MSRQAIIISGNLVQDHEFIYPFYRLLEDSYNVDVCLLGGQPVNGILGTRIPPNKEHPVLTIQNCLDKIKEYDLLVIPGGAKAMEYLRQNKDILNFITKFNSFNKVIACICHGSQLLISSKIVKDKKISGYYSIKDDINNAGAVYTDKPAVVDGNIVTTAHYKDLGPWMKTALELVEKSS
tara:strand:- start:187 stop:726 length:540 start_codon:yes stop_codon:yes gene_type:complete